MRLFAKFFLCATLVISIALLISGYLLITFAHESALRRETDRVLNQFQYDKFTVQASLITHADSLDLDDGGIRTVLRRVSSEPRFSARTERFCIMICRRSTLLPFPMKSRIIPMSSGFILWTTGII
jgi:hypothetical protein